MAAPAVRPVRRSRPGRSDANGILNGDGGARQRVAAKAGQCQQVGLNAGTGGGIAGGKDQNQGGQGGGGNRGVFIEVRAPGGREWG